MQGRALALLVTLEVGIQVVHCGESPPPGEGGTSDKQARGVGGGWHLLQGSFLGPQPGAGVLLGHLFLTATEALVR